MADGHTQSPANEGHSALRVEDVVAEHLPALPGRLACTRLTLRKTWARGGRFIALIGGHLEDGAIHVIADHDRAYRVVLAQAERVA